jgi:AcrR family transcriptional regulator
MLLMSIEASSPRPLRADAERNRRRLLEAAAELFATKGLSVGLDEIARHAGVGVGTAYRRFPDKERLFDALFDDVVDQLVARAREGLAFDDAWEGFVHFMEGAAALHATNRSLRQSLFGNPDRQQRVVRARARISPVVDQLVRRAQASGDLRRDVNVFDMPVLQFTLGSLGEVGHAAPPDLWRRYLQIVLDGLRTPARSELPVAAPTPQELDESIGSPQLQAQSGGLGAA